MSPHHIVSSSDQSLLNSRNTCRLARPIMLPYFAVLQQEVCEISAVKNASGKVDQSSPKSLSACYAIMLLIVPNFITCSQLMYEKSVINFFYTLQDFGTPEGPPSQNSPTLALVYSKAPYINVQNFIPF